MKIVAIGAGTGWGSKLKIWHYLGPIDREIIRLTGKIHPKVLFIPTANEDNEHYYECFKNLYNKRLGCKTDALYLIREKPTKKEIAAKILGSDIIYVGGGNDLRMLKIWRKYGVDNILWKAQKRGIVLSGVSAGAVCWFKYGNSDALKFSNEKNPLIKLRGLNFVPLMICPHYDSEKDRKPSLRKMIKERGGVFLALENCTALEVIDKRYRVLSSSKDANIYRVYKKNGVIVEEEIPKTKEYRKLEELSKRNITLSH
jgi:dipeptidase E